MRFAEPLTEGRLVLRYKRFLADVELSSGQVVTAHCPNPGSMATCAEVGARVWISRAPGKHRRLKWTWEIVRVGRTRVFVNPVRANALVAEALERRIISELDGYEAIRREVRYGRSRIDFLLSGSRRRRRQRCYVEVKNVTLDLGGRRSAFPDSPTDRGIKHLRELEHIRRRGHRAVLLFCASREDTEQVEPADEVDPDYGRALRRAKRAGVELLAYRLKVTPREVRLADPVPVVLRRGR